MSVNPRLHTPSPQSYYIAEDNTTQVTQETTYTYDATGNIVADGTHTYTYDSRNRLIGVDDNITYQYNYDNKRVSKTVNGTTTYFIYDAHKLVGEYDADGNVITEYLYNGDTPIALITAEGIYKIYADHLDTPRRVADSTNAIVWSWESKPFGEDEANGSITMNLRFPGQYYDAETKTHYNINRDYNPVTGRYIQSDPIGFEGGMNSYLYVGGNSLNGIDLNGLAVSVIFKTEQAIGNWSAWNEPAKYAAQLSREEGETPYIYEINRVSKMKEILSNFNSIDEIYIIGHSSNWAIFVGQANAADTNIASSGGKNDISPYSINWNTNGLDSFINIWGCNAGYGREPIAQEIANASGSSVSAYTSSLNFDGNGVPFVKWFRGGKQVWFSPTKHNDGSVIEEVFSLW